MNKEEFRHLLALSLVPGVGNYLVKHLLSYFGSAEKITQKTKGELLKVPSIGNKTAEKILEHKTYFREADKILNDCASGCIQLVSYTEKHFPETLRRFNDSPTHLFYRGDISEINKRKKISIVGTRNASPYGKEVCETIISELKEYSPIVISGMAYGIDICAHRAALKHQLPTYGIVASGPDIIYPPEHVNTTNEMIRCGGAVVSEIPPGLKPEPHFFPARNRIIAGLADVVLVVEAAEKGGALITAEIADSYNIEVYAVPGNITHKYSKGCNTIIQNHTARIFTTTDEMLTYLGWKDEAEKQQKTYRDLSALNTEEQKIVEVLEKTGGITLDILSRETQIELNKLAGALLSLEFQDLVEPLPGNKFKSK